MRLLEIIKGRGGGEPPLLERRAWRRAVVLLVVVALLRGFVYAMLIPPWQSPDEHGHFEYAALMAQLGRVPRSGDVSLPLQQEIMRSMRVMRMWELAFRHPAPPETVDSFLADPDLAQSGRQIGNEPPFYYAFAAVAYLLTSRQPLEVQLHVMRFVSVLMTAVTVALAALAGRDLFPRHSDLQLLVPSLIALHPMLGYIGASVNNDILATLLATLLFWILVRLARFGVHWQRLVALLVVALLGLVAAPQFFFVLPLLLLIGMGALLWRRRFYWLWGGLGVAVTAAVVTGILAAIPTRSAQGWLVQPNFRLAETTATVARSGDRALVLEGVPSAEAEIVGRASEQLGRLRGQRVRASAYVRAESGTVEGYLFVRDETGTTAVPFVADEQWTLATVTYDVPPQAHFFSVGLKLEPGAGTIYADDLLLVIGEGGQENLLFNSSAESTVSLLDRALADGIFLDLGLPWNFHRALWQAGNLSRESLWWYRQSLGMLYRTFWGTFIYLAVSLPGRWYRAINAAVLLAVIGWAWLGLSARRRRNAVGLTNWQWLALLLLGLGAAIDWMLILLTMVRPDRLWQPQGRYLFPLMLPLTVFLALGWQSLVPARLRQYSAALAIGLMFVYDTACLLYMIVPHCYMLS